MICQNCGVEAHTKYVSFYQNIGAFFIRFPKSIQGYLCKTCIHRYFWSMTATTLFLGWWGTISLIVTPFFLLNNVGRYLMCLGMPRVPTEANIPELTQAAVEKLNAHASDLFTRLEEDEDFERVASVIANRAGVTPGQVALYVQAVLQAQSQT